jgi:spectinomycin phosphotransferase
MRERPPLPDAALAATLAAGWGVAAASVEFLPLGDDSQAWSFRVVDADGGRWFCKIRRGPVDPAAVLVPEVLREQGLEQVVAAVPTLAGDPWRPLDGFTLLLYPWVEGTPAMEAGLSDGQWIALGRFVAALHRAKLPAALAATVTRESFVPWGAGPVRALDARVDRERPGDPLGEQLVGLWRVHRGEITTTAGRAERLGRVVAAARPELVLCHGDLHTDNLLVDAEGRLAVVDWDGLLLAPRERDLMFATGEQRTRLLEGYGPVALDPTVTAYYRWEWVVQELADYGGRVLDDRLGEVTRRAAVAEFARLFAPGDVVEAARAAGRGLSSVEPEGVAEEGELEVQEVLGDRLLGGQVGDAREGEDGVGAAGGEQEA